MTKEIAQKRADLVPAKPRGNDDALPASLPKLGWLPDGLGGFVAHQCEVAETGGDWRELPDIENSVREMLRGELESWSAMMGERATQGRLAQWYALIEAGTVGARRNGRDLDSFFEALHAALGSLPAALFCRETQVEALRTLRFLPAVADLYGVLKPHMQRMQVIQTTLAQLAKEPPNGDPA